MSWAAPWQENSQQSEQNGHEKPFDDHGPRLTAHPCQFDRVFDFFLYLADVARPARGKSHSSFVPPLENADGGAPERDKQGHAPPAVDARGYQLTKDDQPDRELNAAADQPLSPFACADVGNAKRFCRTW